jgi:hypothetical protein
MTEAAEVQRFQRTKIADSPLAGVSTAAWDRLVRACSVQGISEISRSGGYGFLDLRPRRLAELGLMESLRSERLNGRQVWRGDFVPPHSEAEFLGSALVQLAAFRLSMRDYDARISSGELRLAEGSSKSGTLAILHRGGTGALASWPRRALSDTMALYRASDGLF